MMSMLSAATKAVMMLAAFAIFFALVCPVAVTPMPVQKHGSSDLGTAPIAMNAAIVVSFHAVFVEPVLLVFERPTSSTNELNCVRNC
jgi:hypothetical protein